MAPLPPPKHQHRKTSTHVPPPVLDWETSAGTARTPISAAAATADDGTGVASRVTPAVATIYPEDSLSTTVACASGECWHCGRMTNASDLNVSQQHDVVTANGNEYAGGVRDRGREEGEAEGGRMSNMRVVPIETTGGVENVDASGSPQPDTPVGEASIFRGTSDTSSHNLRTRENRAGLENVTPSLRLTEEAATDQTPTTVLKALSARHGTAVPPQASLPPSYNHAAYAPPGDGALGARVQESRGRKNTRRGGGSGRGARQKAWLHKSRQRKSGRNSGGRGRRTNVGGGSLGVMRIGRRRSCGGGGGGGGAVARRWVRPEDEVQWRCCYKYALSSSY